jgi:hypothetical protein
MITLSLLSELADYYENGEKIISDEFKLLVAIR